MWNHLFSKYITEGNAGWRGDTFLITLKDSSLAQWVPYAWPTVPPDSGKRTDTQTLSRHAHGPLLVDFASDRLLLPNRRGRSRAPHRPQINLQWLRYAWQERWLMGLSGRRKKCISMIMGDTYILEYVCESTTSSENRMPNGDESEIYTAQARTRYWVLLSFSLVVSICQFSTP